MGRSIGAVIVGFLYAVAAIWLAQMVLWFAVPEDPGPDGNGIVPPIRWILTVVCTFPAAVIAGFIAALVARQSELAHGLAVGAILVLVLGISTLLRRAGRCAGVVSTRAARCRPAGDASGSRVASADPSGSPPCSAAAVTNGSNSLVPCSASFVLLMQQCQTFPARDCGAIICGDTFHFGPMGGFLVARIAQHHSVLGQSVTVAFLSSVLGHLPGFQSGLAGRSSCGGIGGSPSSTTLILAFIVVSG